MCFTVVILDKCRTAFHKLYFEAVCKLEVWLRDGGLLASGGSCKEYTAG